MVGQPFIRALRGLPRSPLSQWPLSQAAPHLSPISRIPQTAPAPRSISQWTSTAPPQLSSARTPAQKPRDGHASVPLFTQNLPSNRRSFSSGPRFHYRQNNNESKYNRFAGSSRPTIFWQLLQRSKPRHWVAVGLAFSGFYIYNTEEVEMTGRRRFNIISHRQELKMGDEAYRETLGSVRRHLLPTDHPVVQLVEDVLNRLIPYAPVEGANWKVHVIKDDGNANAFVLPGYVCPHSSHLAHLYLPIMELFRRRPCQVRLLTRCLLVQWKGLCIHRHSTCLRRRGRLGYRAGTRNCACPGSSHRRAYEQ